LTHALLFVLGFSLIFVLLGAGASALGQLMLAYRVWIARIGGVLMILMGLWMMGVVRMDALQQERRVHLSDKPLGYLGTVVVALGADGRRLGPTLGAILVLAANQSEMAKGIPPDGVLGGLAVPFLLSARGRAVPRLLPVQAQPAAGRIAGSLLIVGVLMLTGGSAVGGMAAAIHPGFSGSA
jgi:cytochrome c-type biogenesis protein